jgi:hypothetical protein
VAVVGVVIFYSFSGVSLLPWLVCRRLRQTSGIAGALLMAAVGAITSVRPPLGAAMRRQNLPDNRHS